MTPRRDPVQSLFAFVSESFSFREREGVYYVRTPLFDLDGEAIEIALEEVGGRLVADDGGRVAGLLFELDQHHTESAGYKVVDGMARAYGMHMDFEEGFIRLPLEDESAGQGAWMMAQFIAALCQTVPHMRLERKERATLGPRLRRRVRRTMRELNVLSLVEQRHEVPGMRKESWVIDFFYRPVSRLVGEPYDVVINTVDLDVVDPIPKAEHVLTLAIDVKQRNPASAIRILYDTHSRNSDAEEAAALIRGYGEDLKYETFDYRNSDESGRFSSLLEQELYDESPLFREIRGSTAVRRPPSEQSRE